MNPIKLQSAPGVKRDGTVLEGEYYIDGQWVRFQRGRPRKMGGYQRVTNSVPEVVRGITSFSANTLQYLHLGSASNLGQYQVNNFGNLNAFTDRTPAAFAANINHIWQLDHFYDSVSTTTKLVAHAAPNLNIDSTINTTIYEGEDTDTAILTDAGIDDISGGIVVIGPYLMLFGNNGNVIWTIPNQFDTTGTGAGSAFITQQKIVKGVALRGAGQGPSALLWSLDSLLRATFVGGSLIWQFDTLSTESSILSTQAVVEYDGVFYWPGVDRFLMFNGVIREVPNNLNQNWFYDNLNFIQRQKVFVFKVPRFGEIWWCYPRGSAVECTHAVIYNVRENSWYDTELPDGGRSAGIYAKVYNKPFLVGSEIEEGEGGFKLWQHETTKDRVDGNNIQAIQSYFETAEMSMIASEQAQDLALRVGRVEPDFVQAGDMELIVKGRINARAPVVSSDPQTFPAVASNGTEETVLLKELRRLMSFRFESNVTGGDYELGEPIALIEPADGRSRT